MDQATVFTKTAKGITQVNQRSASLPKDLMKVLKMIDGKSSFSKILEKSELDKAALEKALNALTRDGFARVFETRKDEALFDSDDDFDFTSPKKHPGATQRVVASSANDISELVRQQDRTDVDRKAKEQAHEAARVKAKSETELRAKLEAEARSKQEAESRAMEQARRAKEASERARLELEVKLREEEARNKALAEQHARLTSEQKAHQDEESRRLVQLRAKAEQEAKALAEARARAEAEAEALARARAEAETAAKRKAKEATSAEAELKARLKDEIESRIRSEMEELLRNEYEEKTRAEMQSQIMAEAKLAAQAELEERLREERETLANAEREARIRAERESRERADHEAKLRAEAEARAAAETEARMRAEEEVRRAREEAHARAREHAETSRRLEEERRAKIEAEARAQVESEQRARRERELSATIAAERRAKETIAEDVRVKVQAELEADLEKKAQSEGKAQARAYMEAKAKAELDEDERLRGEQARKAKEIADILRTKVEPDQEFVSDKPAKRRSRRRTSPLKPLVYGAAALFILAVGLLHVVPMRAYSAKVERAMSVWLHDDVAIGAVTFRLWPSPHLKVEDVAVGKLLDAKAAHGRIYLDLTTLFSDRLAINSLEFEDVRLTSEAVKRIPTWGRPEGKEEAGGIDTIVLRSVRMDVKPAIEPFNANLTFTRKGDLRQATLTSNAGWTAAVKPAEGGMDIDFNAHNWTPPVGMPVQFAEASAKGTLVDAGLVIPQFEGTVFGGKVAGAMKVSWNGGGVHLESDFGVQKMNAQELISSFTKDISVTGRLEGDFKLTADGAGPDTVLEAPRVQGKFRVMDGSISNVDLVAVMQSSEAGQRAGVTKFAELSGDFGAAEHKSAFTKVNLQGGLLRGNGAVDVHPNSTLAGRVSLEIRSQVAQDRGAFAITGTVSRPVIRRGG